MKTELTQIDDKINAFKAAFQAGMNSFERAGKIIVEILDSDPAAADYILSKCDNLTPTALRVFERIGRGHLLPSLAMDTSEGARRLKSLPISMQRQYTDSPIPLVIHTSHGTDVLLVEAKNLTQQQVKQVFAREHVRTEGEQKAWLVQSESEANKPATTSAEPAWKVRNGKVIFTKGATLTAGELATIITQIAK